MRRIDPETLIGKKFLGAPYKLLGKDLATGCDCVGLVINFLEDLGIRYEYDDCKGPLTAHWFVSNPRRLLDAMLSLGTIVRFPNLRQYDCPLFFGSEQKMFPSCIGIMVDDRHFLMTEKDRGSFVAMLDMEWKSRFWSAIRLRKVAEKWGG